MSEHRTRLLTSADPACSGWVEPRCSCGWIGEPEYGYGHAAHAAERHASAALAPPPPVGTGYPDAYGNVWLFNDGGHTVIDGVTTRGAPGRRMLRSGERYYDSRGVVQTVPS